MALRRFAVPRFTVTTNRELTPDDDEEPLELMDLEEFERHVSEYVARRLRDPVQARFEHSLLANPEWAQLLVAERLLPEGFRTGAKH